MNSNEMRQIVYEAFYIAKSDRLGSNLADIRKEKIVDLKYY